MVFNSALRGAGSVSLEVANGARIVEVRTMGRTDNAWVEGVAGENRVAIAAAGVIGEGEEIAVLVVEVDRTGEIVFGDVRCGGESKGVRKLNVFGATTGDASTLSLTQNFPNPFKVNTATSVAYTVPTDGHASIRVYNVLGREVSTLVDATVAAGTYVAQWNGTDASGAPVDEGVYYARIEFNGQTAAVPMHVQK